MNAEQKQLVADFEAHTGFDFLRKDEVHGAHHANFLRLWDYNIRWLADHVNLADDLAKDYRLKHQ